MLEHKEVSRQVAQASPEPSPQVVSAKVDTVASGAPQETMEAKARQEIARVQEALKQNPVSRKQLLAVITAPDVFKAHSVEVPPHTRFESLQMKLGAAKVVALRELMSAQSDRETLYKDLGRIIRRAQDPTIANIARAAQDSLDQGRSFFDDFLDSIDRMEL